MTVPLGSGQPIGWAVQSQRPDVKIGANGQPVEGISVGFQTNAGDMGEVFVPNNQYTADNVRNLILAKAQAMSDVRGLTG